MHRTPVTGKRGKCPSCYQSYTDTDMVECTNCKKWIHYLCAGVDDSVANDPDWQCSICRPKPSNDERQESLIWAPRLSGTPVTTPTVTPPNENPTTSTNTQQVNPGPSTKPPSRPSSVRSFDSKSSRGSAIRAMEKLKLNEEKLRLLEQREKIIEDLSDDELEELDLNGEPAADANKPKVVNAWGGRTFKETMDAFKRSTLDPVIPISVNTHANQPKVINVIEHQSEKPRNYDPFGPLNVNTQAFVAPQSQPPITVHSHTYGTQDPLGTYRPRFSNYAPQSYPQFQRPPMFLSQARQVPGTTFRQETTPRIPHQEATTITRTNLLTPEQTAARHVISKDLPAFNGDPEQWPIFISSYHQTTMACGLTDTENLYRLQKCLKGKARAMVEAQLTLASCVPDIIETLRQFFGRPELILNRQIERIRKLPPVKFGRLDSLVQFATAVKNLTTTLRQADMIDHLNNPMLVKEIVDKLPSGQRLAWANFRSMHEQPNSLETLSNYLYQEATSASLVMNDDEWTNITESQAKEKKKNERVNVHSEDNASTAKKNNACRICSKECKAVSVCPKFKEMPLNNKWDQVKKYRLCRQCLNAHSRRCSKVSECGVNGCSRKHHPLLHNFNNDNTENPHTTNEETNLSHKSSTNKIRFRIIPVTLSNAQYQLTTFAFLDEGSSTSLISNQIADRLKLEGKTEPFCLKWSDETSRLEPDSRVVDIKIKGTYTNAPTFSMPKLRTVRSLNLPTQSLDYSKLSAQYAHLKNLPVESYKDAQPGILIGLRNWNLALPLRVREGAEDEPIAVKCRLGWSVFATVEQEHSDSEYHLHICECQHDAEVEIKDMMKNFFTTDCLGLTKSSDHQETERATNLMNQLTSHNGERYTTGLLWKYDDINLPNSRPMAIKRLRCLENRLQSNPKLAENVRAQIQQYVQKGYIRKLSPEEASKPMDKVWYLPIFPVMNPNKPDKVRIVWDAAAEVNGVSLNSLLMKGTDLNPSLFGVLLRSRERKICITGDIKEMFHQIAISEPDQQALRFLWRDSKSQEPDTYVMKVMTFGASCSPFTAQYVKNTNAMNFASQYLAAVNCIVKDHYVDDLLTSVDTEDEAIELAITIRDIHKNAGFEIRNWKSNSKRVMKALNSQSNDANVNMDISEGNTEKILGMWWCLKTDEYTYSLKYNKGGEHVLNGVKKPTKREVLKTLMSVYDPLGLIGNVLVNLKIILQDIWRTGIGWDDPISDEHYEAWLKWIKLLSHLENLRISRCYLKSFETWSSLECQLHVFVDASDKACAAVAYLRISCGDQVDVALVGSKTKVAPIKLRTIPRLELDAAIIGTRFATQILEFLTIKAQMIVFWSDSKTVLSWIKSDPRQFSKYVGFRVTEIQDNFDASHWRYVPSKLNNADEATKSQKISTISGNCQWFQGPEFLKQDSEFWTNTFECKQTTEEVSNSHDNNEPVHFNVIEIDYLRFSSWKKLLNSSAYVIRFVKNIFAKRNKTKIEMGVLTQSELAIAEINTLKLAQSAEFMQEISSLCRVQDANGLQNTVSKKSPIYTYSPYLDENQLLRVNGRIDYAPEIIPTDVKRPIILPRNNHITRLLILDMHTKYQHRNHEIVINELKQKYMIPKLRATVKKVRQACQFCRVKNANPQVPIMAKLPPARLAAYTAPFTFVGVDYFGPILVTVGRRSEKRYGVLFTCLTVRAIHIEVAHSLTTDAFIMCFHNFISRRGQPREIFSDRGTNFIGAEKTLRQELQRIDPNMIAQKFISPELKWNFNPPLSPHMGGVWERLVRAIKTVLYALLPTPATDPLLVSCLIAAEDIVNSRPLTYIPTSEMEEAITPNHFLKQSSQGLKPIVAMNDDAKYIRNNYEKKEQFANRCWKRFIVEYLPELTLRSKWYEPKRPLKIGDIVVVVDKDLPRNNYPKGRIIDVRTSKDGQVRSATVQTSNGIYDRPVVKLALLN